jgi:squalene-hopene/tetraprenyl-beta-curcumene cyclase
MTGSAADNQLLKPTQFTMKTKPSIKFISSLLGLALVGVCIKATAADAPARSAGTNVVTPVAMPTAAELRAAIDRGVDFLLKSQNPSGWWSTPDQPAVTALVLTTLNLEPSGRFQRNRSSELNHAYDFILSSVKPDGSIQRSGLANYNTSLSVVALTTSFDTNFLPVIIAARKYIASSQIDFGVKGTVDSPFDGGIGYGDKYMHSDMANTITAIEAMRLSEAVLPKDKPDSPLKETDVNWGAVANFLQNCQNLPGVNTNDWVSSDPKERGGFVYYPGESKAGGVTNMQTGRVALRSYGSMSYGGLLSYIYAKVDKGDPRVKAVQNWLRDNYTVEENPAMNQQGYFYYLHLMTKALTAAGVDKLKMADGREVDWRADVASRLLKLQKPNGMWVNPEKRWWEADPVLVTCYATMTLEMIHAHSHR